MSETRERVVVTGLGALTPLGNNVGETWQALLQGRSGIGEITQFDATGYKVRIAGEVKGFDPKAHFDAREARRLDRVAQLAVVAAREAVADAGPGALPDDRGQLSVIVGSGQGGVSTIYTQIRRHVESGPNSVSPFFIMMSMPTSIVVRLAIEFGAQAASYSLASACATGSYAIGEAAGLIRQGLAEVVLAVGAEAEIIPPVLAGFSQMQALSTRNDDPQGACRPFDANRDGFVLGEGSAAMVLEKYERAVSRGAHIYGEVAGFGATFDATSWAEPQEDGEQVARAIQIALRQAHMNPTEIGYINAHGTGTRLNDRAETRAIKRAFGQHAYRLAVSSIKPMIGHLISAAGLIEGVVSLLALSEGCLPPTINLTDPDPDCDLDYIPSQSREMPVRAVLSTNLGLGGFNAAVIFRRAG